MRRSFRQTITLRLFGAIAFVIGIVALIGAVALRERMAAMSPVARSRTAIALAAASAEQPGALQTHARRLALADPLQAASFVLLGIDRVQQDEQAFDRVKPLMDEAARRQPSLEAPQVWLAADFARRGDFKRSLGLFDRVLSQNSDFVEPLLPALTSLLKDGQSRAAVMERLGRFPPWRSTVLDKAIQAEILDRPTVETLLAGPVSASHQPTIDSERGQYLALLIKRGETASAHALYRRYVGITTQVPLYDGNFAAARSFRPFGWTFADQPEDYTERVARPDKGWMLRLHASGKRPVILLEQTLALAPGQWNASVTARDGGLAKPDYLSLAVTCEGVATALASISLGGLTADDRSVGLTFTIPEGCGLQRLSIKTDSGENSPAEIELLGVKVVGL